MVKKLLNRLRKNQFLMVMAVTIFGMICLPLLGIQVMVVHRSADELTVQNKEYYYATISSSVDSFESQLDLLSRIALKISMNADIKRPLQPNSNEYTLYVAAGAISDYNVGLPYVDSVGVYYRSKGFILCNGYRISMDSFYDTYFDNNLETEGELRTFFEEIDELDMISNIDRNGGKNNVLIVARPIRLLSSGEKDAVAFFILNHDDMVTSYSNAASAQLSFAAIDSSGAFLLRDENFPIGIWETSGFDAFLKDSQEKVITLTDEDQEYMVYKMSDTSSGNNFLLAGGRSELEQILGKYSGSMTTMLIASVAMVCVMMALTIYINYRPIYKLREKHIGKNSNPDDNLSEFALIDSAIFAMDERLATQRELLTEMVIGDILFGSPVDQEIAHSYFPSDKWNQFVVGTAYCERLSRTMASFLASQIAENGNWDILVVEAPYRRLMVIVCASTDTINENAFSDAVVKSLRQLGMSTEQVQIGSVVSDVMDLRTSYLDALVQKEQVEISGLGQKEDCQNRALKEFSKQLNIGDEERIKEVLNKLEEFCLSGALSESGKIYFCYNLLNVYFSALKRELRANDAEVERLIAFKNPEHMFVMLRQSVAVACRSATDNENNADLQIRDKLLQYVNENYCDTALCLISAADYMETSIYVVSRLFKEATGRGFKEYITEKRLDKACELLVTTKDSISVISGKVGFENPTYFSTLFKLQYGIPPVQYRKNSGV